MCKSILKLCSYEQIINFRNTMDSMLRTLRIEPQDITSVMTSKLILLIELASTHHRVWITYIGFQFTITSH